MIKMREALTKFLNNILLEQEPTTTNTNCSMNPQDYHDLCDWVECTDDTQCHS